MYEDTLEYAEGQDAARRGAPRDGNPYHPLGCYMSWANGWDSAKELPEDEPRTCLFCEHFGFSVSGPWYETDVEIECSKGHRGADAISRFDIPDLRAWLLKGADCEDNVRVKP